MKTYLTYGFIMTLAGAFVNLGLHFSGFYSDPGKMQTAQNVGIIAGLAITITGVLLGMRDKRAGTPADKPWGYGSALGTGVMIGLFSCILSAFYNYAYFAFINPDFTEVVVETQLAAMEAKNVPAAHIDGAEPMIRKFSSPGVMTVMGMIMGFLWTVVISLVVAAFVKNRPAGTAVAA